MCCASDFVKRIIYCCFVVNVCGSNEYLNNSRFRVSRELKTAGCQLPQHPLFGKWNIYEETSSYNPNQVVGHRTILQVSCNENYKLDGEATIVCTNGKWTAPIGECLRTCPSRYSTAIMTITCRNNERKLENCENPTDGTKARFQCADFYEDRALERNPVHVCFNGNWNHKLPECTPICGQKSINDDPTLIVGGKNVTRGDYPWQVALYNATNKEQLCGGSLLNQKVILTAAHCVTDSDGNLLSKDNYLVAVGKYFRDFNHASDMDLAQFSEIFEMHIPRQYKGDVQNYLGDLAILVTKTTFILSTRVQPVCVDWALSRFPITLNLKRIEHGYVSGWGYTKQHKDPSNVLKELQVPIIGERDCSKKIPEDYQRYLTDDKFCAGFTDAGTSVCKGDSGGGLVVKYGGRYYVIGIVSLAPQASSPEGGCDSQHYSLYTKVQYYVDNFILDKEALFRPDIGALNCYDDSNCNVISPTTPTTTTLSTVTRKPIYTCILPDHPISGKWSIFGVSASFSPGQTAQSGTILRISCDPDYKVTGSDSTVCENGKWTKEIGQCLRSCAPLHSSETTKITCSFDDKELNDCSQAVHGTIAKQKCAPFYEDLQLAKNPVRVCRNGSWDMNRAECVPICGLKSVTPQTLIVNGNNVERGKYPWQVAIYRGTQKHFICSGALISPKLILTAAHCVTSSLKGELLSKYDYFVAVGKFYREYYDPLDLRAQFSEIQDMFVPMEYEGLSANYLADVAILVAKKTFTLSKQVQPVCVDWGLKHAASLKNISGYVAGWGFTSPNAHLSETLQDLEAPIIPKKECIKKFSSDHGVFINDAKFCAGYLNQNISVCTGDAGAAFVTNHDGRYYVTGIVSHDPSSSSQRGCNSNQYTLYTNVSEHIGFILEKDAKIKGSFPLATNCSTNGDCETATSKPPPQPPLYETQCVLPDHPEFGRWEIFTTLPAVNRTRFFAAEGTVLQVRCYKSYKLDGNAIILCEKGKWSSNIGKCLKVCPPVRSSAIVHAKCIINNKEHSNCTEAIDGDRVRYQCAEFYEDPKLTKNPIQVCNDGIWSGSRPQCRPACGLQSINAIISQIFRYDNQSIEAVDYPWHIGIYQEENGKNKFLCNGILISQQTILTAADCVTDSMGKSYPKEQFTVVAGKYYRNFDDSREKASNVQSFKLLEIAINPDYKYSTGNIAILVTNKRVTLSSTSTPICLDWDLSYSNEFKSDNLTGFVAGWGYSAETDKSADQLQELLVPIVRREKCEQKRSGQSVTSDKICAGYQYKDKSLCNGDSGGALVAKFNGRYFVVGIIGSIRKNSSGNCDSLVYALYTNISMYFDNFIIEKVYQYKYEY